MTDQKQSPDIPPGLIWCCLGHRPDRIGGYSDHAAARVLELAVAALECYQPSGVISGVSLGWDLAVSKAALQIGIPLTSAVAFAGQEVRWTHKDRTLYQFVLAQAKRVEIISPGGYTNDAIARKNIWMVDHAEALLGLWDRSQGALAECMRYASRQDTNMPNRVFNLWSSWQKYGFSLPPSSSNLH